MRKASSSDIDDYVALRFYRLTQQWSGAIEVKEDEGDYTVKGPTDVGTAGQPPVKKPLSTLINKLNDLFGLDLTDADKLSFDQIEEALVANAHLAEQARANDQEHYTFGFDPAFDAAVVERVLKNDSIFTRLQEDPIFKAIVRDLMKSCAAGIFIFSADEEFRTKEGKIIFRPRENVIYELGAASLEYGRRIVIFKEVSVTFPSDFHDLGYIEFEKGKLDAKAMDLLRELISLGAVRITTG